MPGGDRTGPLGAGPMTGRGAGYCAGFAVPGYANAAPGYGAGRGFFGRGGGRGRGGWARAGGAPGWGRAVWGMFTGAPQGPQAESDALRQHADALQSQLDEVRRRLDELSPKESR